MAVNALTYLQKDHIWVLKVTKKKDVLREMIKGDIPWALKTIIKSYGNACSMKQVKAELVPSILEDKEWNSWSTAARKQLKDDPAFGNLVDKIDSFMVREKPISKEEKCFTKFKAAKNFYSKYKALQDFLAVAETESEYFTEIFNYFAGYLKAFSNVDDQVISSYFIVNDIVKKYPYMNPNISYTFEQLIDDVGEIEMIFAQIDNNNLKQRFLEEIKIKENWPEIYARLFPRSYNAFIVTELENSENTVMLKNLFSQVLDKYKESREAFIWIARNYASETWCELYNFRYEKILIGMLHLLDITFREISNRREVSLNRKLNKQIHNWLFKESKLEDYINKADQEANVRIFTLVEDVRDLDPSLKIELKDLIVERFPDFKFYGGVEVEKEIVSRGLLVTEKAYKAKQKEYRHIIDVEIPENSAEIGAAIELGDLSENAEYKAGKEKQELLNISANKIKEEIDKAQIIDLTTTKIDSIVFGTKVTLVNKDTKSEEIYTLLGPWESDPTNNIISYMAPFGIELLNKKAGETLSFIINERNYNFDVKEINKAEY